MLYKNQLKLLVKKSNLLLNKVCSYHQGIPAITVIVDGGWSKRTHKHSYNALSGVGVIFGKHTGKLLYVGVRNKFCAAGTKENCFKNWNGTSAKGLLAQFVAPSLTEAKKKATRLLQKTH